MIFAPDMIALIQQRRKSMTRRPVKPDEKQCRYRIGSAYKVQPGRGQRGVMQITITAVRQELLGEITVKDARCEGFRFTAEFLAYWKQLYGIVDAQQPVWVISFMAGDATDRFDQPRLLTSIGRIGQVNYETVPGKPGGHGVHRWPAGDHSEDYTDRTDLAMWGTADAGEALSARQLEPYVKDAHRRDDVRQRAINAAIPRGQRLEAIERAARSGDKQAQRHLFVIDQRIQAAERKRSRAA